MEREGGYFSCVAAIIHIHVHAKQRQGKKTVSSAYNITPLVRTCTLAVHVHASVGVHVHAHVHY